MIKTVIRRVGWQFATDIEIKTQQVSHRIAILGSTEPSHNHTPWHTELCRNVLSQLTTNPPGDRVSLSIRGLRLSLGRHFASLNSVQDVLPERDGLAAHEIAIKRVEPNIAFLLIGSVTCDAVFILSLIHI